MSSLSEATSSVARLRALWVRWDDVFLLEALPKHGMGASARNSGVIHSGLYYMPGSLNRRISRGYKGIDSLPIPLGQLQPSQR